MIVTTQTKLSIFNLVCHYFLVSCFIHLFNHRHYWHSLLWWYFLTQIGICPLVSCISRFVTLFLCRTLFLLFAPIFICFFTLFHIDFRLYLRLCSLRYWPSKFQYHSIQHYIISNKFFFLTSIISDLALLKLYLSLSTSPATVLLICATLSCFKHLTSVSVSHTRYSFISFSIFLLSFKSPVFNDFHNVLRLFDVSPNFIFPTSETMFDYHL